MPPLLQEAADGLTFDLNTVANLVTMIFVLGAGAAGVFVYRRAGMLDGRDGRSGNGGENGNGSALRRGAINPDIAKAGDLATSWWIAQIMEVREEHQRDRIAMQTAIETMSAKIEKGFTTTERQLGELIHVSERQQRQNGGTQR